MQSESTGNTPNQTVSKTAQNLIGSEIIKLAGEIKEKIKLGEKIHNFTIGDFDPAIFPIPEELKEEIIKAYQANETNYPEANGMLELRKAVSDYLKFYGDLDYSADQILISGGARPLIYAIYQTFIDAGESVLFPVPSWNNNHYTYLSQANAIAVETKSENNFMPTAAELAPYIHEASLVSLCSPLNPTGTVFTKTNLEEICDLILLENKRRGLNQKPVYLMYDQIYWTLTFGEISHYNPVILRPEMRDYTVFVDGISKSFAATGVRVGWSFGPAFFIDKMKAILSHIGAWAPKAEQIATAKYLSNHTATSQFIDSMRSRIEKRLLKFHQGFQLLKSEGFMVDSVAPQGAIYLTVKFALHNKTTSDSQTLKSTKDVTKYLLEEAKLALVPFYAFGASPESEWYRLSVGTCDYSEIDSVLELLKNALQKLN